MNPHSLDDYVARWRHHDDEVHQREEGAVATL